MANCQIALKIYIFSNNNTILAFMPLLLGGIKY